MSKSLVKFSIFLTMNLFLFVQQGLALTKSITSHVEPVAQTKNNNETRELIPIDAWESVQQGMNTFLQMDSAMTQQFFGGNQRSFNYFRLKEDPKQFLILVDLPGVDPKKIRVSVSQGILSVQAKDIPAQSKQNSSNQNYFFYHMALPENANTQKMSAVLQRGVLQITIAKTRKLASMIDIPVKEIA